MRGIGRARYTLEFKGCELASNFDPGRFHAYHIEKT